MNWIDAFLTLLIVTGTVEIMGSFSARYVSTWYKLTLLKYTKVDEQFLKTNMFYSGIALIIIGIGGFIMVHVK